MNEEISILQIIADNFSNILTVISSLGGAIAGGMIASKANRKNDIQKLLREERVHLYIEFFEVAEKVRKDPLLIFDEKYVELIKGYKVKLRLLASNQVVDEYENFFLYVNKKLSLYKTFASEHNPYSDEEHTDLSTNEDGEFLIELKYKSECQQYRNSNTPTAKELKAFADKLYGAMRNDLGSAKE